MVLNKDDGVVLKFTGKKAEPRNNELMLVPPPANACRHFTTGFEVSRTSGDCKCLLCGERVTAMFVLEQLMNAESRWNRTRMQYQDEMARLAARSKTKCQHCGEMTRISGN